MISLTKKRPQTDSDNSSYMFDVSDGGKDSNWDSFLSGLSSNRHLQSSLWSAVKAINGWRTKRITVSQAGRIVGGAQLLIRNVRCVGSIGYVPKGPVLPSEDRVLADDLLKRIREMATAERLRVLFVQPPENGIFVERLAKHGFRTCPVETAPSATILVDLSSDLDTILSRMTKGMRNGVRRSQNRGITVREGTKNDLSTFHQLLTATSGRRGFTTFDLEYFQGMWDILEPEGCFKLFLAELNDEAVSAQVCVPFGDTVVAKQIGWSGKHSRLHPNEALDWFTIRWAKDNGYKYYDLEGIERAAATAIINGHSLPQEYAASPTSFKLRLGGDVVLYPEAYCFIANPVLRSIYNRVGFQVVQWSILQKAISRFRTS